MISAKKSLGQNFLIDKNVIDKIVNVLELKNKNILEIGPGTGNLTEEILKKSPKKVLVVEKDDSLANLLKEKFKDRIDVINKDILKIDENSLSNQALTVFGNLPYNISTEILCKWILNIKQIIWFDCLVLMFQKEVADRIIAKVDTENYSRITILANWKFNIKKLFDINPQCFFPKPKIKSTLLEFTPKKQLILETKTCSLYRLCSVPNVRFLRNVFIDSRSH